MSGIPEYAQTNLLRFAADVLKDLGIPYFVTGSQATIIYGEPRFTNDVDIVVELAIEQISAFLKAFEKDEFYLSESAVKDAINRRSMFNLIDSMTGGKIDFVVSKDSEFDRSRFARVRPLQFSETDSVTFASPEDVILKKMQWYKKDRSERHIRDILGVLKVQGIEIDDRYIESWLERLDVGEVWQQIRARIVKKNPNYE
jgi:hypothetical protein